MIRKSNNLEEVSFMTAKRNLSVTSVTVAVVMGAFLSLLASREARAITTTLQPTITFEVGDGFFGTAPFDGQGDAVFPGNFDTVVHGTFAENSENAEFNLSGFSLPPQQSITSSIFQVQISSLQVGGSGVNVGQNPTSLAVRGYVGNGQPDASDFQAGTILDTVNLSSPFVGQIVQFDVSSFVKNLVSNGNSFAGFGVRAQDFGGLALTRPPKVTLAITTTTKTVPEPSPALGILAFCSLGAVSMLKRRRC